MVGGGLIFFLFETIRAKNTGFEIKTLWDWMELLIIPMVLAVGAFYLNRSERAVERQIAETRVKEDRQLADDRANLEREIATDRQQEAALQAYLDRMADLLLHEKLRTTENEEIRDIARIRTLTVLRGLDATRKGLVLHFLNEAELVGKQNPIVSLKGADLRHAKLIAFDLRNVDLSYANLYNANLLDADFRGANLKYAVLNNAFLFNVNFHDADLTGAYLNDTDLQSSNMSGANLTGTCLNGADLCSSNLSGIDLSCAALKDANLTGANMTDSQITAEQLANVKSLKRATMPDGTKHE